MKSTRNRSRLADQGTKEMLPVIFSLAWPTMLEQLMQTAVQYMDTGMVGVLGTSATAAVGATSTVNWADWKYDFCDQHRISGIHIPVNRSRKKRTGKKSFRTGCADSCDRRNIFYNSDNGTEP